jgi:hypothetical protein
MCTCVVPVLPGCSFVLALRELGLRLGVKAQLPLRASSRGVLPGAGDLAGYRARISAGKLIMRPPQAQGALKKK